MCLFGIYLTEICLMNKSHNQKSSFIISNDQSHGFYILSVGGLPLLKVLKNVTDHMFLV
jgi:hypothetical protein